MGRTTDLIDAVRDDLVANVPGWPSGTKTYSYAEPGNVTPENCPLLAVYCKRLPRDLIATDHLYRRRQVIEVAWYTSSTAGAETGGALDPDQARDVLNMLEAIGDRCEIYADGVPGLASGPDGTYLTITDSEIDDQKGFVWKAIVTLETWQA